MANASAGTALLEAIHSTLVEKIVPELDGEARYNGLMAARAIRMAAREMEQADLAAAADGQLRSVVEQADADAGTSMGALCRSIRSGGFDRSADLHHALWARAAVAVSISRPSFLTRMERRIADMPESDAAS